MRDLNVEGELVLGRATSLKEQLLGALDDPSPLELRLSQVTRIDTVGVQLLLVVRECARRRGVEVTFAEPGLVVGQALATLRLTGEFGLARRVEEV